MKRLRALAFLAAVLILLPGCGMAKSGADYRYRMEVVVDTPHGPKVAMVAMKF